MSGSSLTHLLSEKISTKRCGLKLIRVVDDLAEMASALRGAAFYEREALFFLLANF